MQRLGVKVSIEDKNPFKIPLKSLKLPIMVVLYCLSVPLTKPVFSPLLDWIVFSSSEQQMKSLA